MNIQTALTQMKQREAQILTAMGKANLEEQRRLAADLEDLRAQRHQVIEADRSIDLADTVIRDHLTPVIPHAHTTAATDWLDEVPDSVDSDIDSIARNMRTEATLWWQRTSVDVKADRDEVAEQAKGMARHLASSYGLSAAAARHAFLDQVSHLSGRKIAEEDEWVAEGDAADYSDDGEPTSATDPRGRPLDESGQGTSVLPTPENNPAVFDTLMPAVPAADVYPSQVVEENREASRRVAANVVAPSLDALGEKLRQMGLDFTAVNYPDGNLPDGGGQGYRKIEIRLNDGHVHQETVQLVPSTGEWIVNIPSWVTSSKQANWDDEYISSCPACGQPIDYCQGHGEIGDPEGARILEQHDDGDHSDCHPDGCDVADGFIEDVTATRKQARSVSEIAAEIASDWGNVNFAAKPYLEAMFSLDSISDMYYSDSGKSIVAYFLNNAGSYRGEKAKELKAELRAMQKGGSKTAATRGRKTGAKIINRRPLNPGEHHNECSHSPRQGGDDSGSSCEVLTLEGVEETSEVETCVLHEIADTVLALDDADPESEDYYDRYDRAMEWAGRIASRRHASDPVADESGQGTSGLENAEEDEEYWTEVAFDEPFEDGPKGKEPRVERDARRHQAGENWYHDEGNASGPFSDEERSDMDSVRTPGATYSWGEGDGQGAADVADVPTPGQEVADYPQPHGAAKRQQAFRQRIQSNINRQGARR